MTGKVVSKLAQAAQREIYNFAFFYTDQFLTSGDVDELVFRSAFLWEQLPEKDHLNESAVKFAERLKRLGGTCRASKSADIIGVKRQTINNRLKAKKLLAVQVEGESIFPTFQFDGNRMVDGLEEVSLLLGYFSPVTKTSFSTAMYFFDDEENLNAIDALKKYGTIGGQMKET